jgi:hypothetical protein
MLAHAQQNGEFAMTQRVIQLVPLLDSDRYPFIFDRLFGASI